MEHDRGSYLVPVIVGLPSSKLILLGSDFFGIFYRRVLDARNRIRVESSLEMGSFFVRKIEIVFSPVRENQVEDGTKF